MRTEYCHTPLFIGASFLFVTILAELTAILLLNNGIFVYTLDDPYIHMALAENLSNGHYGVNSSEFSAPSSSILWPFIIALLPSFEYFPLLLNIVFAILTLFVFYKILDLSFIINNKNTRTVLISSLLILLICGTNTIGLIFTGMEHSLQLLVVMIIAFGLIVEVERNKVEPWLIFAIIVAPLIRYENSAIACAAIAYLFMRKYYKPTIVSVSLLVLFAGGFSIFLILLSLGPLPTSILAKSSVVESGGKLYSILENLKNSLISRRGNLLIYGAIGLMGVSFFANNTKKRLLATITIFAILMHLIAGDYGWYNRYEIYIWAFLLVISCYFSGERTAILFTGAKRNSNLIKMIILAGSFTTITCLPYIVGLFTIPPASNSIYRQQYQMHRFAVDYYKKPVAVNDLGLVSYKNSNYVLDLWGLASLEALRHRKNNDDSEWMNTLAKSKNIELAMIYENKFKTIPNDWIKVGNLNLENEIMTPSLSEVAFYAMNQDAYKEIMSKLPDFLKTLPENVVFHFVKKTTNNVLTLDD